MISSSSESRAVADVDGRARVAGVLERVRQRLLHDPVGRQLDPDRAAERRSPSMCNSTGRPASRHLRDERRQVVEPRLRRERVGCVAAQHPDQAAHLGQRAAADLLDRLEHLSRRPVRLVEHTALGARLHDHHRDVVRDRVVQLARDPRPLFDHRLPRATSRSRSASCSAALAVAETRGQQHHHKRHDRERDRSAASVPPGPRSARCCSPRRRPRPRRSGAAASTPSVRRARRTTRSSCRRSAVSRQNAKTSGDHGLRGDTCERRVATPERRHDAVPAGARATAATSRGAGCAAQPDLELGGDERARSQGGGRARQRVGQQRADAEDRSVHTLEP